MEFQLFPITSEEFDVFFTMAAYQVPLGNSFTAIKTRCMCNSKPNSWLIAIMKGPSVARLRLVQYQKSITSAHWVEMDERVQKAPLHLTQNWDSSLEECLTATSIQPMFLSRSAFLRPPPPLSPLQGTSLIQAKGLTLKQSLPLILAWLSRPPICSQCAWYPSTAASPLIKTDIDRRMWISTVIMCLLRIITVFSHSYENKGKLLRNGQGQRSQVFFFSLILFPFLCRCVF